MVSTAWRCCGLRALRSGIASASIRLGQDFFPLLLVLLVGKFSLDDLAQKEVEPLSLGQLGAGRGSRIGFSGALPGFLLADHLINLGFDFRHALLVGRRLRRRGRRSWAGDPLA